MWKFIETIYPSLSTGGMVTSMMMVPPSLSDDAVDRVAAAIALPVRHRRARYAPTHSLLFSLRTLLIANFIIKQVTHLQHANVSTVR